MAKRTVHSSLGQLLCVLLIFLLQKFSAGEQWLWPGSLGLMAFAFALAVWRSLALRGQATLRKMFFVSDLALAIAAALYLAASYADNAISGPMHSLMAALLLFAALHLLAIEWVLHSGRHMASCNNTQLKHSVMAAGILSCALSASALLNYSVQAVDQRIDLSLNAPSSPSEALIKLSQDSEQALEFLLFFEEHSPVLAEIQDYFASFEELGIPVRRLDQQLEFKLAKELKVQSNGHITLIAGERSSNWYLGEDYQKARWRIPQMDRALHEQLSKLGRQQRTVYVTHEHGERRDRLQVDGERDGAETFSRLLHALNNKVLYLSPARLAREVPRDADLVVVHGPTQAFSHSESLALQAYIDRGGALLLLLDPEENSALEDVLSSLGLQRGRDILAHERDYFRDTQTPADKAFIFSTSFAKHPAISSLNEVRRRATLMFRRAGSLQRLPNSQAKISFLAQSRSRTYADRNGNWQFDQGLEAHSIFHLAAAVEKPSEQGMNARALVIADSDVFDDKLLTSEPNKQFALDAVLWLLRDEAQSGEIINPEQAPIRHTRDADRLWFYGSTLGVPLLILGLGYLRLRSKRSRMASSP